MFKKRSCLFFMFCLLSVSFLPVGQVYCMQDSEDMESVQEVSVQNAENNIGFDLVKKFKLPVEYIWRVAIDKVNNLVAFVSSQEVDVVQIWRVGDQDEKEKLVFKYAHDAYVLALNFSENGKYLASASKDGDVKIVDLQDHSISQVPLVGLDAKALLKDVKKLVRMYEKEDAREHTNNIQVLFCSTGTYLAISFFRKVFYLYNMKTGKLQKYDIKYPIVNFAFSPNSRWLALISSDKFGWSNGKFNYRAELFDLEKSTVKVLFDYKHMSYCMEMYENLKQSGYLLNFSLDSKYLAVLKIYNGVSVYNLKNGKEFIVSDGSSMGKRMVFPACGKKIFYYNTCGACYRGDLNRMQQPDGKRCLRWGTPAFSFGQSICKLLCTPDARYLLIEGFKSRRLNRRALKKPHGRVFVIADFSKKHRNQKRVYFFRYGGHDDPGVMAIDFSYDYHYIISVLQDGQVYMHRTSDKLRQSNKPYVLRKKYEVSDEQERTESIKNNDFQTSNFSVNLGGGKKLHCCKSFLSQ